MLAEIFMLGLETRLRMAAQAPTTATSDTRFVPLMQRTPRPSEPEARRDSASS
jgi:hypothetical protein